MPVLVLCAPMPTERLDLAERLSSTSYSDFFEIDGNVLRGASFSYELDLRPADPRMVAAFSASASRVNPSLDQAELDAIAQHKSVLYLVSEQANTDEEALAMAQRAQYVVAALHEAGCLGVKCESSGIAHGLDRWIALQQQTRAGFAAGREGDDGGFDTAFAALIDAWVRLPLLGDDGLLHTCGMHLLGRPEVAVRQSDIGSESEAVMLLSLFAGYSCRNHDRMHDGEGFRVAADAARFIMRRDAGSWYASDDLFHNPWGHWLLERDKGGPVRDAVPSSVSDEAGASAGDGESAAVPWWKRIFRR